MVDASQAASTFFTLGSVAVGIAATLGGIGGLIALGALVWWLSGKPDGAVVREAAAAKAAAAAAGAKTAGLWSVRGALAAAAGAYQWQTDHWSEVVAAGMVLLVAVPVGVATRLLADVASIDGANEDTQQQVAAALAFTGCMVLAIPAMWAFWSDTTYLLPACIAVLALGVMPAALVTAGAGAVLASNAPSRKETGASPTNTNTATILNAVGLSAGIPALLLALFAYTLSSSPAGMSYTLLALLLLAVLPAALASAANGVVALKSMGDIRAGAVAAARAQAP